MSEHSAEEAPSEEALTQVVEKLNAASEEVSEANLLSSQIAGDESLDRNAARPFVFAFGFMLHLNPEHADSPADYPFGPNMTGKTEDGDPFRFPPPFSEMDQPFIDAWEFAYESDPSPMVKARIGDLLWEKRAGERPDQFARGAISALLETAGHPRRHAVLRSFDLTRALQLSLSIRDAAISELVIETMLRFLDETSSDPESPGPPMTVFRALIPLDEETRPEGLEERLEHALATYAGHVDIEQEVLDLAATLKTGDDLTAVRSKQLDLLLSASESADSGILRVVWLHRALDHATRHNFHDRAGQIRSTLDNIPQEELELETFSTDIGPDENRREFLTNVVEKAGSAEGALAALSDAPSPLGTQEDLEDLVDELSRQAPLSTLFPQQLIGPEGAGSIYSGDNDERQRALVIASQKTFMLQSWGAEVWFFLNQVREQYGTPTHEELTQLFASEIVEEGVADRFARSLELFWGCQFDESAHLLAPRIEKVIRHLAKLMGVPVMREQMGDTPGGVATLGTLLDGIKPKFASEA